MAHWFTVEGRGCFPRDMLRYDSARVEGEDQIALVNADDGDPILECEREGGRTGLLRYRIRVTTEDPMSPHTARWESFGWRVVEVGPGLFGPLSAPRGRPSVHVEGTSASERSRISDGRLAESGGVRRSVRLSKQALDSLSAIRGVTGETSDAAVIDRLIIEEGKRLAA